MLDKMREGSQGIVAKSILGVIILSFALAGVSSYLGGSSEKIAVEVNGQEISQAQVDQAYKTERANVEKLYGEQFESLAANPNFVKQIRAQATRKLVSDTLIGQAIEDLNLRVSDEQIKDVIRSRPEFQDDGVFNNDKYLSVLRRASYTPASYSALIKDDLIRRQLTDILVGSEFVLPNEISVANTLQTQKRIARTLTVKTSSFMKGVTVNNTEINDFYNKNKASFQYPEQTSINYILLDGSKFSKDIKISQADIEKYYDEHQSDYQRAERRKVAHILIKGDSDKAKQKAQAILDELKAGADFAKLAKQKSEEKFSAKNSGELDWFEAGVMESSFDKASFVLTKQAPLSNLVKTKFGYHIIKLLDIEPKVTLPLDDVKAKIKTTLQKTKLSDRYFELQQKLSEVAFESPDSLDDAASAINADVIHTKLFSANHIPEVLADKKVSRLLFDQDFRDEGLNSDLIELADNKAIVLRINEYKAATPKALSDVSEVIASQLKLDKARAKAQAFVETIMMKLKAKESVASLLSAKNIKFSKDITFTRYSQGIDYKVIAKVFKLAKPSEDKMSYASVATSTGDFVIIDLAKVVETASSDEKYIDQLTSILTRSASEQTYESFVEQLIKNADIKYYVNQ